MMYRGRNNRILSIFVSFVSRGITTIFRLALSGSWSSGQGLGGAGRTPEAPVFVSLVVGHTSYSQNRGKMHVLETRLPSLQLFR